MKKKILWCCVDENNEPAITSLRATEEQSKQAFLYPPGLTNWDFYQKRGWKCIKVKVTIQPISTPLST